MRRPPWSGCWPSRPGTDVDYVPHVVAWNLTRRCNLECAHCYIAAGPSESAATELDTAACLKIIDQLLRANPAPLLILSGGEPLLREDLTEIARYASGNGATVVVGTNGTLLSDDRIATLKQAGVQGLAVSVDSLRPSYHDNFRHGRGALADVQAALARLSAARLDFIVQTTVTRGNRAELERLVDWSAEQGAVSLTCYFLVSTGPGASLTDLAPAHYEAVLAADPSCVYEPTGDTALIEPAREIAYGDDFQPALAWSPAARERVARIPSFVRGVVMERVEAWARRQGRREVTPELLAEVRSAMPIDFAKKRPFFVADGR